MLAIKQNRNVLKKCPTFFNEIRWLWFPQDFFLLLNAWYNVNYKAIKSFKVSQFYPKHPACIIFFKKRRRIFYFCFQNFQRQNNTENIVSDGKSMTTCSILHNNRHWFDMMHLNDFLTIQPYYKILVALHIKAI